MEDSPLQQKLLAVLSLLLASALLAAIYMICTGNIVVGAPFALVALLGIVLFDRFVLE